MEPIRVLNIVGLMGPGGIETMVLNMYKNIDRNKVQFDFLTHYGQEGPYDKVIESLGGRIYQMPKIKDFNKTYYYKLFEYIKALNKFFDEHREFKIIHGHMTNTASIYMPIAKKYGSKCCIAHSHLTEARPGLSGVVTDILHKPVKKCADEYFACSEMAGKWIFPESYIAQGRVTVLKNGVQSKLYAYDKEKSAEMKRKLGVEGKFVVGNVARFKPEKNQTFLVDVFAEILKKNKDSVLLLIGSGETFETVKKKAKDLGMEEQIKFLGIRYDVPDIMQAMDVFVLPSLYEGLPVVGIEAQASGLPCIISEGVTSETDVTGLCTFLNLNKGAEIWANKILENCKFENRKNTQSMIIKAGYDITNTAKYMEDFYLKKYAEIIGMSK